MVRVLLVFLFINLPLNAKTLFEKQTEINKLWEDSLYNDKQVIIGIDIGGTKLDWSIYLANSKLDKKIIYSETVKTPKGILNLANCYYDIILKAISIAKHHRSYIKGIGISSPGRFIEYEKKDQFIDNNILEQIGNPFVIEPSLFSISKKNTIARGTAENLGERSGEFDGVALESLFQRLSPKHVKVVVNNSSAIQLKALVSTINEKLTKNKKIIYINLGTSLGTAVMGKKGKIVTDGHFQYIKINKIKADSNVYNIIKIVNSEKYAKINASADIVLPEDIFSSTGIGNILKDTFGVDTLPKNFDDIIYADNKKSDLAKQRIKSVGKYMGYFLAKIRSGKFHHFDRNAEWSDFDKSQIKYFSTVVFDGGIVQNSKFFKELILPEIKKVLVNHDLEERITMVIPDNKNINITYSAADIVYGLIPHNKPIIYMTFDDGPDNMHTDTILALLKKYNVKATFFVVGSMVDRHPEILKRTAEQGHAICIHTYNHPNLNKLSDEKIISEITRTSDAIHKILPDYKINCMRPPYGEADARVRKIMHTLGIKVILWNALGHDYLKIATPEYIKKSIDTSLELNNGGTILLHDGGGHVTSGINSNPKFRVGKQNVVDYLEMDLANLVQKYEFKIF